MNVVNVVAWRRGVDVRSNSFVCKLHDDSFGVVNRTNQVFHLVCLHQQSLKCGEKKKKKKRKRKKEGRRHQHCAHVSMSPKDAVSKRRRWDCTGPFSGMSGVEWAGARGGETELSPAL